MSSRYGLQFDRLPDRNECGGVGGCLIMRVAHDLETQMGDELETWRLARRGGAS